MSSLRAVLVSAEPVARCLRETLPDFSTVDGLLEPRL